MHTDESSGMNGDAGPAGARTSIAPAKVQRRLKLQGMPDDAAATVASAMLGATRAQNARHADDVVLIANAVCDRMGVTAAELDDVLAAARLHDIGKTAIPVEVLEKPGPLSESEWELVREHTVIAEEVLSSVAELRGVAKLVRHSHERWDGNGYPDGLRGDEIPLGSRIIFCADAFQAIRSDRPYRAARSSPEALDEVRRCSGTQFDPAVVDALQDAVKELGILAAGWPLLALAQADRAAGGSRGCHRGHRPRPYRRALRRRRGQLARRTAGRQRSLPALRRGLRLGLVRRRRRLPGRWMRSAPWRQAPWQGGRRQRSQRRARGLGGPRLGADRRQRARRARSHKPRRRQPASRRRQRRRQWRRARGRRPGWRPAGWPARRHR